MRNNGLGSDGNLALLDLKAHQLNRVVGIEDFAAGEGAAFTDSPERGGTHRGSVYVAPIQRL